MRHPDWYPDWRHDAVYQLEEKNARLKSEFRLGEGETRELLHCDLPINIRKTDKKQSDPRPNIQGFRDGSISHSKKDHR
jgi:hypothetical protein